MSKGKFIVVLVSTVGIMFFMAKENVSCANSHDAVVQRIVKKDLKQRTQGALRYSNMYIRGEISRVMPLSFTNDDYYRGGRLQSSIMPSIGVGYKFNTYFGAELSIARLPNITFHRTWTDNISLTNILSEEEMQLAENAGIISSGVMPISIRHKQSFNSTLGMLHGIAYIGSYDKVLPYVKMGLGYAKTKVGSYKMYYAATNNTITRNGRMNGKVIWDVGLGLEYNISTATTVDFSCRYINLGKVRSGNVDTEINNGIETSQSSPSIVARLGIYAIGIGLRYSF